MTYIKPSAAIRNHYNEIADLCKSTGSPVYLTKNGEGELVVMDIESFSRRESEWKLMSELIEIEQKCHSGEMKYYTVEELEENLNRIVEEAEERERLAATEAVNA
jgi:PHD/YefM family antitoxin component YafN of YafNO toxin-antitoxin module